MRYVFLVLASGLFAAIVGGGCGKGDGAKPAATTDTADPKIQAALAELSPEDRAAAEKQEVCPVSGEKLGSMGKPYKTTVKGQTVFLCCDGCEDELKKEPDKYLAKLKK